MERKNIFSRILYLLAIITAGISSVLGLAVTIGWHTHNVTLIQITPEFVPMQYNTALGFLLGGAGILSLLFGIKRLAAVCGGVVGALGLLTLAQYITGFDLGIDQLFMKSYITVLTSSPPGRMAPNSAVCFSLIGFAIMFMIAINKSRYCIPIVELFSSFVVALGTVALLGYLSHVKAAYGWGSFKSMAVHTAAGFAALGLSIFILAWREEAIRKTTPLPIWLNFSIGIGLATITVAFWQALMAQLSAGQSPFLPYSILTVGLLVSTLSVFLIRVTQTSLLRAAALTKNNLELEKQINERKKTEEALNKMNSELQDALSKVKLLTGLLPICASCKKIRNERGDWEGLEKYIERHSAAAFSHSICPECTKKLYPDFFKDVS